MIRTHKYHDLKYFRTAPHSANKNLWKRSYQKKNEKDKRSINKVFRKKYVTKFQNWSTQISFQYYTRDFPKLTYMVFIFHHNILKISLFNNNTNCEVQLIIYESPNKPCVNRHHFFLKAHYPYVVILIKLQCNENTPKSWNGYKA